MIFSFCLCQTVVAGTLLVDHTCWNSAARVKFLLLAIGRTLICKVGTLYVDHTRMTAVVVSFRCQCSPSRFSFSSCWTVSVVSCLQTPGSEKIFDTLLFSKVAGP